MEQDFDFNVLTVAMVALVMRSLATLVPVFVALVFTGLAVDYYFSEYAFAGLFGGVLQFVISYFLAKGLARHSGLLAEGEHGPGFGAYFGVSFVIGLGTSLGYLFLVLPGIFLSVRWLLAFPFLFAGENYEGRDGAIGSSWAMTGPVFWKLLAAYAVVLVLYGATVLAVLQYDGAADETTALLWLGVGNTANAVGTLYVLVLGFAAFLLLRTDRDELVRIFS